MRQTEMGSKFKDIPNYTGNPPRQKCSLFIKKERKKEIFLLQKHYSKTQASDELFRKLENVIILSF